MEKAKDPSAHGYAVICDMPGEPGMPQDDAVSICKNVFRLREEDQSISSSEHAPGPRGSPQVPHAPPLDAKALSFSPPLTANREIFCSSFVLSHLGQAAFCEPSTMLSN